MLEQDIIAQEGDLFWEVPEYQKHDRTKVWYIMAAIITIGLMVYALMANNYLFLGIIIMGAFVMVMNDGGEPMMVPVVIGDEGIQVGSKFHDYDQIKNFSVIFKPRLDVKNLYVEFKSPVRPRLSLPLGDLDPLLIREALLRYLPEDLDRTDQPTSEGLAKILKL